MPKNIINKMKKETEFEKLKKKYAQACNGMVLLFLKKQEYGIDDWYWVLDAPGGICAVIDQYYFDWADILWDMESEQPVNLIFEWADECVKHSLSEVDLPFDTAFPDYQEYCVEIKK